MISERLSELQRAGVIRREVRQHGPPTHTQYTLTPVGARLARIAQELSEVAAADKLDPV